jgi:hypothetical protein
MRAAIGHALFLHLEERTDVRLLDLDNTHYLVSVPKVS